MDWLWRDLCASGQIGGSDAAASLCLHEWCEALLNGCQECLSNWIHQWRGICESTPRFQDHKYPKLVYKLKKAFYGLKQTPQKSYEWLSNFLLSQSYERGKRDKTLFIKKTCNDIILVQV